MGDCISEISTTAELKLISLVLAQLSTQQSSTVGKVIKLLTPPGKGGMYPH